MKRWQFISMSIVACCVATATSGGETIGGADWLASSGYVFVVETSESDCENKEGTALSLISDSTRFRLLADDWLNATEFDSSVTRALLHPSHIKIVEMDGEVTLPLILAELRDRGGHWYWDLYRLTNVEMGQRGNKLAVVRNRWLEWGKQHGHLHS